MLDSLYPTLISYQTALLSHSRTRALMHSIPTGKRQERVARRAVSRTRTGTRRWRTERTSAQATPRL